MSRHMLQLEAALLQGKAHLPLAHIYVNGVKKYSQQLASINSTGASVNDILLPGSVSDASSDSSFYSVNSPTQIVPKSPPSPPQQAASPPNKKAKEEGKGETGVTDHKNGNINGTTNGNTNGNGNGDDKVVITGKVESIAESDFEKGRRSAEEIAKQFPNYNIGTPCKVCPPSLIVLSPRSILNKLQILYVKNLDHAITAQDLVSIFIRFQEEGKDKINFKIMDGKMKGQAFITFHGTFHLSSHCLPLIYCR